MVFFDISPIINSELAVFPGDVPFHRKIALDINQGDHLTLSSIETTLHIGAHADAPSHYHSSGKTIEQRPLDLYFGATQVITGSKTTSGCVELKDLSTQEIKAPRVLIKTSSYTDPQTWSPKFKGVSVDLIDFLFSRGVRLIGVDTPSIDPADSKDLPAHQAVFKNDMAILEGLVLAGVSDGNYFLSALPLALDGADASPVRAALWDLKWLHNETR